MNVLLMLSGSVALLAAAIHGGAGERLVVRRLSTAELPSTRFGGPQMTLSMIRVTWHIATIGFLAVGTALILSGSVLEGDVARGISLAAAWGSTGFALPAVAAVIARPSVLRRHLGPVALTAIPVLAWLGIA